MMKSIGVEDVRQIANLAREASDAHRDLLAGFRNIELGDQDLERGSRNPTDLDTLNLLDNTANRQEIDRLRAAVEKLSPEQRQELKATMLIGRGDFAAGEWDRAMDAAAGIPESADADYLAEKLLLHDYLAKALYEMKCL